MFASAVKIQDGSLHGRSDITDFCADFTSGLVVHLPWGRYSVQGIPKINYFLVILPVCGNELIVAT